MPKIRVGVNLDDVESGFQVYPDDIYLVEIQQSSKITKSKESQNPMIRWIGLILEGEYEEKRISWQTVLVPDALWNLKAMLEAIEVAWDEEGFEMEDCIGKKLYVQNVVRDYEGTPRNNVTAYYPESAVFKNG